ncbi:MAG TPA: V-type ATP synthase subunit F [Lachnospiraceae bacterium]|jgi:V/A-type H+-transporting ATPase subunit F|nr:V-type ATP synthase subunit F [Lachnospiraceae bacterium]HBR04405.1 V-type ATP synthase subunit F [Lachnospiraceae bacterium]HBZ89545.1 V-type ATP synthase subunit F [Lachnospiraceae bacterium]
MHKVAVMGDQDSIYGYKTLGLSVFPETDKEEAIKKLKSLADGGYAVIFITEKLADQIQEVIDHYRNMMLPAIILIPGVSGNTGKGMNAVKKSVEQAVGSDILFGDGK